MARAADLGVYLQEKLNELYRYPIVGNVRGLGTLWAVELVGSRETRSPLNPPGKAGGFIAEFCRKAGMILRNNGDVLVLAPALVMTVGQADRMLDLLHGAIGKAMNHCEPKNDVYQWTRGTSAN